MNKWKCGNCGYIVETIEAPAVCPSCKQKCEFTDANCYTPDCGIIDKDYMDKSKK